MANAFRTTENVKTEEKQVADSQIRNVRVKKARETGRDPSPQYDEKKYGTQSWYEDDVGPLVREFENEKSVQANVRAKKKRGRKRTRSLTETDEYVQYGMPSRAELLRIATAQSNLNSVQNTIVQKALRISSFSKWMSIGAIWTVFMWQFVFGIISIIGFGIQAALIEFNTSTTIGKVVSFFVDLEKYIPGELLGKAFWALGVILAFGAFTVYLFFFSMTGQKPFETFISTLVTLGCLACSIIPVLNLIPWLPGWVIYMNSKSLFNTAPH